MLRQGRVGYTKPHARCVYRDDHDNNNHTYPLPPTPVIWNLSKRADNASGLVQPETFDMLFHLLCQDEEEGDVLRRVVSCVQNLASMRACASDLTDYIASDPSVSNVLGTLFGLLAGGGAKNMHQRVLGTFANLAYLCVGGDASEEWAGHLRYAALGEETF